MPGEWFFRAKSTYFDTPNLDRSRTKQTRFFVIFQVNRTLATVSARALVWQMMPDDIRRGGGGREPT